MGWTYGQIDDLLLGDFDEIVERWNAQPHDDDGEELPVADLPREMSEQEFRRMANAEQAFAEKKGGARNPFL